MRPLATRGRARRRAGGERGSQFLEFAVYLPFLLLVVTIAMEVFLAFIAIERMENAAAVGAQQAGLRGLESGAAEVHNTLPEWVDPESVTVAVNSDGGYYAEITVRMPLLFPAAGLDFPLTRRVDMPAL